MHVEALIAALATGNVVWLERRDPERIQRGNRVLERATIGTCVGLPVAVAALFAANWWLPEAIASRASLEVVVFWSAWSVAFAAAFVGGARKNVAAQSLFAGALFASTVITDVIRAPQSFADPHVRAVPIALAALAILAIGCAVAFALRIARSRVPDAGFSAPQPNCPARDQPKSKMTA